MQKGRKSETVSRWERSSDAGGDSESGGGDAGTGDASGGSDAGSGGDSGGSGGGSGGGGGSDGALRFSSRAYLTGGLEIAAIDRPEHPLFRAPQQR